MSSTVEAMTYELVRPPFTRLPPALSKAELRDYAQWFHDALPARIAELAAAVQATAGYEAWEPDDTAASIDGLARWFQAQCERRPRTAEELAALRASLAFPVEVAEYELTDRTLSLAMDVGMYLGRVTLAQVPGTRWDQQFKTTTDYGQPVIVGLGTVPFNPVAIARTCAYEAFSGKPPRLRAVWDYWVTEMPRKAPPPPRRTRTPKRG
jgi:hypothetical protein